jgi:hypothetical protein
MIEQIAKDSRSGLSLVYMEKLCNDILENPNDPQLVIEIASEMLSVVKAGAEIWEFILRTIIHRRRFLWRKTRPREITAAAKPRIDSAVVSRSTCFV